MKKILIAATLALVSSNCLASEETGKYEQGDCIMASDTNYSWFGEYAKVEAYSRIKGFAGPQYILYFPTYKANAVVFGTEIEAHTIKVGKNYCQE
ncbi:MULTISPECIES: hypothetical protein [Citrobacter]|uniref:hypothetical protein n=1 Tax=Citrobacter TaxID=544 RepID=UPI000622454C|nr:MULTISPECIES: hypothetical protein [Citrobacter]KKF68135.1 hypothetical protein XU19_21245 [Vibrio parahaemolyticus]EKW5935494.1 hypothetical protein [Citrobacter farmeri]ELB4229630.1 hypothetical protein [Citrobacter amalonaticus]KKY44570.1 hypothetical protein AAY51_02665 [Vibrio parahaemolyticus]KOP99154.1 hypothetical protein AL012_02655 [Citrobacter amalonaticus]